MVAKTTPQTPAARMPRIKPATGAHPTPLDATLGFALLKDRRICVWQKTRALATGASMVAGMILVTTVAARFTGNGGRPVSPLLDGTTLAAGSLLFGALVLKRLAPREVVSRVRCERFRVIPLRTRKTDTSATVRAASETDALAALGYSYPAVEAREYAVIPRRSR